MRLIYEFLDLVSLKAINILKPRSQYNHIIWGLFIFVFGVTFGISTDKPTKDELDFFHRVQGSYEYWIGILAVLILNVLVGIYTAKKYKKDKI